jgi:hypothetical protein
MSFYDFDDKAGLLDRMLAGPAHRLGRQAPEHHPSMPRFQGRELPLDQQLDAVRRRDQRMAALNRKRVWRPTDARGKPAGAFG